MVSIDSMVREIGRKRNERLGKRRLFNQKEMSVQSLGVQSALSRSVEFGHGFRRDSMVCWFQTSSCVHTNDSRVGTAFSAGSGRPLLCSPLLCSVPLSPVLSVLTSIYRHRTVQNSSDGTSAVVLCRRLSRFTAVDY